MKRTFYTLICLAPLSFALPLQAADEHAGHMGHSMHAAAPATQWMEGKVKKVDPAAGRVTISHESAAGMPAMTMLFRVKEAAWLEKLQAGQSIRFISEEKDGMGLITRLELKK